MAMPVGSSDGLGVLMGTLVGEMLKFVAKAEMKIHCRGSASPSMIVFDRPSVTEAKATTGLR